MHVLISWDILAPGEEAALDSALRECFRGYSWVKPLRRLYIVKLKSAGDREEIRAALVGVCSSNPKKVHLVVGPVLSAERVNESETDSFRI